MTVGERLECGVLLLAAVRALFLLREFAQTRLAIYLITFIAFSRLISKTFAYQALEHVADLLLLLHDLSLAECQLN